MLQGFYGCAWDKGVRWWSCAMSYSCVAQLRCTIGIVGRSINSACTSGKGKRADCVGKKIMHSNTLLPGGATMCGVQTLSVVKLSLNSLSLCRSVGVHPSSHPYG